MRWRAAGAANVEEAPLQHGNFVAEAGSRLILEVQAEGQGGFDTDLVVFNGSSTIDLDALNIEFRFLGATDPNAFQTSGKFDIDTFLAATDSGGQQVALDRRCWPTRHSAHAPTATRSRASVSTPAAARCSTPCRCPSRARG